MFTMTGLHADSIRKRFGDKQVLNSVFLSCRPGEIVGLLGRNGTGKSTLLKIIFGSLSADTQFVAINNRKVKSIFQRRKLLQYLPQNNFLPDHVTIKRIINCLYHKKVAHFILEQDWIKPFLGKKTKQLSGGERRMIEILLTIYSDVPYVLLDEPFNGLSPLHIERIKKVVKTHAKEKGFVITDHNYRNVLDISTKIILMDDGNTKPINDPKELILFGYIPSSHADGI